MNIIKVGPGPRVRGVHAPNLSHLGRDFNSGACSSRVAFDPLYVTSLCLRPKSLSRSQCQPVLISRQPLHICLAGGQGMMENNGVRIHFFFFSFTLLVIDFFFFPVRCSFRKLDIAKDVKSILHPVRVFIVTVFVQLYFFRNIHRRYKLDG